VINYRVKNGDTLWKIASRYDVSVTQIKKWNNLRSTKLATGDKLRIFVD
jgi:membrane-bound lytic murein transglycosylase D